MPGLCQETHRWNPRPDCGQAKGVCCRAVLTSRTVRSQNQSHGVAAHQDLQTIPCRNRQEHHWTMVRRDGCLHQQCPSTQ